MNMNFDLLKNLVGVFGPSSREDLVRDYIVHEINDYVDEVKIDVLGNLIAHKKGKGKKIMISAHMDQIALMVIDIDDKGFIRFTNIGGICPINSISQQVVFENGTIGVIFAESIDDMSKLKLENMYIDIGVFSKEEAESKVEIGDICIYKSEFIENENIVCSRYLDNRVGCFIAIEALKSIKNPINDLYFVFSVQEEVGLRGAKTAAYSIDPDIGMSLDVTMTGDTPEAKRLAVNLNGGAAIKVKDNSIICHPKIKDLLVELSKKNNIPYQMEVLEIAGTDSGAIHLSREGVPSGVISIPTRYVHSTMEMASKNDIKSCTKLLIKFLEDKLNI